MYFSNESLSVKLHNSIQPYACCISIPYTANVSFEKYIYNNKEVIFEKTGDWETRKDL